MLSFSRLIGNYIAYIHTHTHMHTYARNAKHGKTENIWTGKKEKNQGMIEQKREIFCHLKL